MFESAQHIIDRLEYNGFAAYFVGGCVRDALMGRSFSDIDIATSARPEEICTVFQDCKTVDTGMRHGTVTVFCGESSYEITTFRKEGTYSDGRHPDSVLFTDHISEDLARRDFTVNAIAYHPRHGLIDPYGGKSDLQKRLIRCVGDPADRFSEDALRILRALRFSAVLGFSIEEQTSSAINSCASALSILSSERIVSELTKILCSGGVTDSLLRWSKVYCTIIPSLKPMTGYDQRNPHHCYDLYQHTAHAVGCSVPDLCVRLALLLHDTGKPACAFLDEDGIGHFYGHAAESASLAADFFASYSSFGAHIRDEVIKLITYHDLQLGDTPASIRRWCNRLSPDSLRRLLLVKQGDLTAMAPHPHRLAVVDHQLQLLDQLIAEQSCMNLRQLAVNGHDMMDLGYSGPVIGRILKSLLDDVLSDRLPNTREALLQQAQAALDDLKEDSC